jgi:hypothetical protein
MFLGGATIAAALHRGWAAIKSDYFEQLTVLAMLLGVNFC